MGVVGDATHGTPLVSSRSLYPVLGVQEGIRVARCPGNPPLPGRVTGKCNDLLQQGHTTSLWLTSYPRVLTCALGAGEDLGLGVFGTTFWRDRTDELGKPSSRIFLHALGTAVRAGGGWHVLQVVITNPVSPHG